MELKIEDTDNRDMNTTNLELQNGYHVTINPEDLLLNAIQNNYDTMEHALQYATYILGAKIMKLYLGD